MTSSFAANVEFADMRLESMSIAPVYMYVYVKDILSVYVRTCK